VTFGIPSVPSGRAAGQGEQAVEHGAAAGAQAIVFVLGGDPGLQATYRLRGRQQNSAGTYMSLTYTEATTGTSFAASRAAP
jgi:hypothetical protein